MIKNTGERVIPEKMKITNELLIEHIARYHFATHYVYGRVLDFACGVGFRSHIVAKKCKHKISEVIGIDIDQNTVKYAKSNYYHPLTTYMKESVIDPYLVEKLGNFDSIISFETIEHVFEETKFLENIYKLLKPEGTLILSTPFGKGRGKPCKSPFHVHQLTINEFKNLFDRYSNSDIFFQKGALIEPAIPEKYKHYPLGIALCKK